MRRLSTIVCGGALLAGSAVVGAGPVLATTPPDDDGSAAALAQFETLGLQYGFTLIDPACSANPSEGTDLTYTCYAMTTLGEPFIASTTLSGTDVVEFDIIAQPGQPLDPSATGTPGAEDSAPFDALGYFDALFSGDAERIATLQASTAPGSPAEAYAVFQIEFVQTLGEAGGEPSDASVFLTGDGVLICVQARRVRPRHRPAGGERPARRVPDRRRGHRSAPRAAPPTRSRSARRPPSCGRRTARSIAATSCSTSS